MSIASGISTVLKSKKFLFALGITGVGLTAITAVTGTLMAKKHVDEAVEEKYRMTPDNEKPDAPEPITKVETLKVVWKDYVATAASISITTIIFARLFGKMKGENAALHGMLSASEATIQHMQDKMVEKLGDKKGPAAISEAKQEALSENPPRVVETKPSLLSGVPADDILSVCCSIDGRCFKTTKTLLLKALEQLNLDLHDYGEASLNNFYENLGQDEFIIGDLMKWESTSLNDYKVDLIWDTNWCGAYVDKDGHAWTYLKFTEDPKVIEE